MNVALLSDCYLPRLGGIEVQVHDLARALVRRGHEVQIFCATPGPHGERVRRGPHQDRAEYLDGIAVHRLAIRLPFDLPVNPLAPAELRRRLVTGQFDVAHVHTGVVSPFAVDATRVALRIGLPTAMTWHCMLARTAPLFRASRYVRGWARRGVAMNAVSGVAAAAVQQVIGTAGTVEVLPNGIDVARWAPPTGDTGGRTGGPVRLVTAMRLAARKRPMALLHLMIRLRQTSPAMEGARLHVVGDGPMRARMERAVRRHGLSEVVELAGRVSREELRGRYLASDIYLAPAVLESFGIAALEARTTGLPVVGRIGSGVGEFVRDGIEGLLAGDDETFVAAVARLVGDDRLRARIAEHNALVPPSQGWDAVTDRAAQEYDRAVRLARVAAR